MRLITQVTSLDSSSMLLKRFPRSGFFNFGDKSKSGVLSPLVPKIEETTPWERFRSIEEVT
jgi:hypothetical protein